MALPAGVDPVIFGDLKSKYENGDVVVFAGAGVSIGAGLPGWAELARRLIVRMREMGAPSDNVLEAEDHVASNNLIAALSDARLFLKGEFDIEIQRHLRHDDRDPPELAHAIAALKPKLSGVVTTNLDHFVEDALGSGWRPLLRPVDDLLQRPRYVLKAHGTLDDPETWVFTRDEYDSVMFGSTKLLSLFEALYRARTLLFVGASLTDEDFGLTLGRIRALAGRTAPRHYAILPAPVLPNRRDTLERAGIRLLVYKNDSGNHAEAAAILRELAGATATLGAPGAPAATPPPATPPPATPPVRTAPPATAPPATAPPATAPPARSVIGQGTSGTGKGSVNLPATAAPAGPTPGVAGPRPVVFLSASPADEKLRDRLISHFQTLDEKLRLLTEKDVLPGMPRTATLTGFVGSARIVLLLISADYLASKEHMAIATQALARVRQGAVVVPVIARACGWKFGPLADLEPLPSDGEPIARRSDVDGTLFDVVEGVRKLLESA